MQNFMREQHRIAQEEDANSKQKKFEAEILAARLENEKITLVNTSLDCIAKDLLPHLDIPLTSPR